MAWLLDGSHQYDTARRGRGRRCANAPYRVTSPRDPPEGSITGPLSPSLGCFDPDVAVGRDNAPVSDDNVEVVRRSVEAAAQGDFEAAAAELHPDVEVEDTDIPDAGYYRGSEGYFRWLAQWSESWQSWDVENIDFHSSDDGRVVVLFDMIARGKGSGIEMTRGDALVCSVRERKVSRLVYYNDQARALREVGLAP